MACPAAAGGRWSGPLSRPNARGYSTTQANVNAPTWSRPACVERKVWRPCRLASNGADVIVRVAVVPRSRREQEQERRLRSGRGVVE